MQNLSVAFLVFSKEKKQGDSKETFCRLGRITQFLKKNVFDLSGCNTPLSSMSTHKNCYIRFHLNVIYIFL